MTRKEANTEIVRLLLNYISMNPDIRFTQALRALDIEIRDENGNIKDEFYVEPEQILLRVQEAMRR